MFVTFLFSFVRLYIAVGLETLQLLLACV